HRDGEPLTSYWSAGKRRDYNTSLKQGLSFRELVKAEEVNMFLEILKQRLLTHDAKPVHTAEEIILLKEKHIPGLIRLYGVYLDDIMIAGTMLFSFNNEVLHTQYLAHDTRYSSLYPMNYLIYQVMKLAKDEGYRALSFGISTEAHGMVLNTGLASFKEGFGARYCNNRTYCKTLR
uniref:GNAT family N-acetyltransferase n=1 Tax=Ruminococcus sp. TaxID=41978 RepID=UPI00258526E4